MKMLIENKWVNAFDKTTIKIINPANGEIMDTVPNAGPEDVGLAVNAAKTSQKTWGKTQLYQRIEILQKFCSLVDENQENLSRTLSAETGKPIRIAREEIQGVTGTFLAYIEAAKHMKNDFIPNGTQPGQNNSVYFTLREPLGVIAIIVPFNYPAAIFAGAAAPAFLTGNTVILKPPHQNPLTLCKLAGLIKDAAGDFEIIQILTGDGLKAGNALTTHPDVNGIHFTGSTRIGIEIARAAASHLAHVNLELGGNDVFIVHEDADINQAARDIIIGRLLNSGQICTSSKRVIVHNMVKDDFIQKVLENIRKIKVGDPANEETDMGCLISEAAALQVEKQVQQTVEQGAEIIYGGKRSGAFFDPTILVNVPKTADIARDMEVFGPVIAIIGYDSIEEAVEISNSSRYGLGGSVYTGSIKTAMRFIRSIETGSLMINGTNWDQNGELPFQPYKYSGIGAGGILLSFEHVSHLKSIGMKNIF